MRKVNAHLLFFATASVFIVAIPVVTTAQSQLKYSSPCKDLTGLNQSHCRRFEAMSYVRLVAAKGAEERFKRLQQNLFSGKTSVKLRLEKSMYQLSRDEYLEKVKEVAPEMYADYIRDEEESLKARHVLRKLTRFPNEKDLRLALIKQKGDYLNANKNDASLRNALLKDHRKFIRSFATK